MFGRLFSLEGAYKNRVFGLDVMRAIAILVVVDSHSTMALGPYSTGSVLHQFIPDGVELFFVLSGFLIGGILIRLFEKHPEFNVQVLLNFWVRRWFRTLPNYYLVLSGLVVFALFQSWRSGVPANLPSWGVLARYFVFLQNFTAQTPGFFPETWSLAIEEWSYLILPVVIWLCCRLAPASWSRKHIVLTAILLVIIGTNLLRLFHALSVPIEEGELNYRGIVLMRLDAIAYGVLAAYFKQYYSRAWTSLRLRRGLLLVGLVCIVLTALSASIFVIHVYYDLGVLDGYTFYKRTVYFLLIGLSMTLLLPYMDGWQTAGSWLEKSGVARAITHISLISYSMYLLNLTPIMVLGIEQIPTTSLMTGWLKIGLFWVLVVTLSTLLFKYFEKPATELRDKLTPKEPKSMTGKSTPGESTPGGLTADVQATKAV